MPETKENLYRGCKKTVCYGCLSSDGHCFSQVSVGPLGTGGAAIEMNAAAMPSVFTRCFQSSWTNSWRKKNPEDITHKRTSSSSLSDRLLAARKHCSTLAGFSCSCLSEIRCLLSDPYCRGSSAPGQLWTRFLERQELIPYCFPDVALWSYSPTETGF